MVHGREDHDGAQDGRRRGEFVRSRPRFTGDHGEAGRADQTSEQAGPAVERDAERVLAPIQVDQRAEDIEARIERADGDRQPDGARRQERRQPLRIATAMPCSRAAPGATAPPRASPSPRTARRRNTGSCRRNPATWRRCSPPGGGRRSRDVQAGRRGRRPPELSVAPPAAIVDTARSASPKPVQANQRTRRLKARSISGASTRTPPRMMSSASTIDMPAIVNMSVVV